MKEKTKFVGRQRNWYNDKSALKGTLRGNA